MAEGTAKIEIIGTSPIHKELLNKVYENVKIISIFDDAIQIQTGTFNIILNSNFITKFTYGGLILEGFALIENSLGKISISITEYICK